MEKLEYYNEKILYDRRDLVMRKWNEVLGTFSTLASANACGSYSDDINFLVYELFRGDYDEITSKLGYVQDSINTFKENFVGVSLSAREKISVFKTTSDYLAVSYKYCRDINRIICKKVNEQEEQENKMSRFAEELDYFGQ